MQKQGSDELEYRRSGVHFRQGYLISLLREIENLGTVIDNSNVLSTPVGVRRVAGADLSLTLLLERVRGILAIEQDEDGKRIRGSFTRYRTVFSEMQDGWQVVDMSYDGERIASFADWGDAQHYADWMNEAEELGA